MTPQNASRGRRRFMLGAVAGLVVPNLVGAETSCNPQSCDARIKTSKFAMVKATQQTLVWCWAATLEMIFRWYGKQISQQDIVFQTFGSLVAAPASPIVLINSVNRAYRERTGAAFSVDARIWGPDFGVNQIDNGTLIDSLSNDRPLVVCNVTHMMALVGINYALFPGGGVRVEQAWVADPMVVGKVTPDLAAGFRYLMPAEMAPVTIGGQLRFVADLDVS